ncbi:sodium-dependent glucose transporter 1-like [Acanthaster planci]|uniref:Sodium-dependent glucose transporter 1-like n=1 Tax=Acanthaster planci TaxID=133434 RepID=A0A8B7ZJZ7_ACAPL|nr:sodium-dependent glucose transporter 1-like [Acanthaster planci]
MTEVDASVRYASLRPVQRLSVAVLGPTLLALKEQLTVSFPEISYIFVGRSTGYLAGSVCMGLAIGALDTANPTSESEVEVSSAVSPGQFRNVYMIIGVFSMLVSVSFFYFFCTSPVRPPSSTTFRQNEDRKAMSKDFKYTVVDLMFLFYCLYVGAEVTFGGYIFTFAIRAQKGQLFDETSASLLNSAFWGSFATGRGLSICLASVLELHVMLTLDMVGCIASSIALSWCGDTNSTVLWVGTVVLGLSMASLFPAGISWLESYYKVTGSMATILVVGSSFGEMAFPMLMGWMLRQKDDIMTSGFLQAGPIGLMYFMLTTAGLTAIIFIVMQYLAKQHRWSRQSLGPQTQPRISSWVCTIPSTWRN